MAAAAGVDRLEKLVDAERLQRIASIDDLKRELETQRRVLSEVVGGLRRPGEACHWEPVAATATDVREVLEDLRAAIDKAQVHSKAREASTMAEVASCRADTDAVRAALADLRRELAGTKEQQVVQGSQTETLLRDMCKQLGALHEALRRQGEAASPPPEAGPDAREEARELRRLLRSGAGGVGRCVEEVSEARGDVGQMKLAVAAEHAACARASAEVRQRTEEVAAALWEQQALAGRLEGGLERRLAEERRQRLAGMAEMWARTEEILGQALEEERGPPPPAAAPAAPAAEDALPEETSALPTAAAQRLEEQIRSQAATAKRVEALELEFHQAGPAACAADVRHLEAELRRIDGDVICMAAQLAGCEGRLAALDVPAAKPHAVFGSTLSQVTQTDPVVLALSASLPGGPRRPAAAARAGGLLELADSAEVSSWTPPAPGPAVAAAAATTAAKQPCGGGGGPPTIIAVPGSYSFQLLAAHAQRQGQH